MGVLGGTTGILMVDAYTLGSGLGFSNNGGFGAQFSGSIGVRAFGWDDRIDVHGGLGIASLTATESEATEGDLESRGFMIVQAGFGFFHGLFCVSYMHAFDPFVDTRENGHGVSLYADAVAIEHLLQSRKE